MALFIVLLDTWRKLFFVWIILACISCSHESKHTLQISSVEPTIVLFDTAFYAIENTDTLSHVVDVVRKYKSFLGNKIDTSIWMSRVSDPVFRAFSDSLSTYFSTHKALEELTAACRRFHTWDREKNTLELLMFNSALELKEPVVVREHKIMVGLEHFLGQDHILYAGLAPYLRGPKTPDYLAYEVIKEILEQQYPISMRGELLDMMIAHGAQLYVLSRLLDREGTDFLMRTTPEKAQWLEDNEPQIWSYFLQQGLLYTAKKDVAQRFIAPAPFSKFYTDMDRQSPGSAGIWIGLQIVQSYAEHNTLSLQKLFALSRKDPQAILKGSKYRP